jgi:hypothetical protein
VIDLDSHLDTAAADLWAAVGETELGLPEARQARRGIAAIGATIIVTLSVVGAGWLVSHQRSEGQTASHPLTSVSATDQLAAEVASAAHELGWGLSLPDLIPSNADPAAPTIPATSERIYAEVHFKNGDGQLLVSMCVCDDAAVSAGTNGRAGLLRTDDTASVYLGTDGDYARAVELYDHSRILYVRSESASVAVSLDELTNLALAINSATAFPALLPDNGVPAVSTSLPDRPFDLLTHCGINGAMIDGVWWQASPVLSDGQGNPPDGWDNPYQSGVLHFADETNATFTGNPQKGSNLEVNLRRTTSTEYPFLCS